MAVVVVAPAAAVCSVESVSSLMGIKPGGAMVAVVVLVLLLVSDLRVTVVVTLFVIRPLTVLTAGVTPLAAVTTIPAGRAMFVRAIIGGDIGTTVGRKEKHV